MRQESGGQEPGVQEHEGQDSEGTRILTTDFGSGQPHACHSEGQESGEQNLGDKSLGDKSLGDKNPDLRIVDLVCHMLALKYVCASVQCSHVF